MADIVDSPPVRDVSDSEEDSAMQIARPQPTSLLLPHQPSAPVSPADSLPESIRLSRSASRKGSIIARAGSMEYLLLSDSPELPRQRVGKLGHIKGVSGPVCMPTTAVHFCRGPSHCTGPMCVDVLNAWFTCTDPSSLAASVASSTRSLPEDPDGSDGGLHESDVFSPTAPGTHSLDPNTIIASQPRQTAKPRPKTWWKTVCCLPDAPKQPPQPPSKHPLTSVASSKALPVDVVLLPPPHANHRDRMTLVIDLDETLVHSSFSIVQSDFVVRILVEDSPLTIYVAKRPHVDEFLKFCSAHFETVIFTASVSSYANAVIDVLDPEEELCHHRLFREACSMSSEGHVKDLGRLGRPINKILILDNSEISYMWHPENAIPISSWYDDTRDKELLEVMDILKDQLQLQQGRM